MTDGELSDEKRRQLNEYLFPIPKPSLRERLRGRKHEDAVAILTSFDDAVAWARSHQVGVPSGGSWRQKVDLRLSPDSLPVLAELLGSSDSALMMTASLALQYNGVRIDSDATPSSDPTFNRLTFPDGSELTVNLNLS
ncbi:MAG: hypothetical protein ABSF84_16320 [Acidimicrobiales bacterium]|jgi:hypothetical protein